MQTRSICVGTPAEAQQF